MSVPRRLGEAGTRIRADKVGGIVLLSYRMITLNVGDTKIDLRMLDSPRTRYGPVGVGILQPITGHHG
jgi:hypothetical protein